MHEPEFLLGLERLALPRPPLASGDHRPAGPVRLDVLRCPPERELYVIVSEERGPAGTNALDDPGAAWTTVAGLLDGLGICEPDAPLRLIERRIDPDGRVRSILEVLPGTPVRWAPIYSGRLRYALDLLYAPPGFAPVAAAFRAGLLVTP